MSSDKEEIVSPPSKRNDVAYSINAYEDTRNANIAVPHDPTDYIQKARITRAQPPKPAYDPLQFVQLKPCSLVKNAQAQMLKADEVKKVKDEKKEEPEEWQCNLDNWKSSRRKRVEHIIDRVVEVKKYELEEHDRNRRKSKTFNEMMEERGSRRLKFLPVYTDDDNNDLSDLGIHSSDSSQKTIEETNVENSRNTPSPETSTDRDFNEYTYEGAIEDYKSRISRATHAANDTQRLENKGQPKVKIQLQVNLRNEIAPLPSDRKLSDASIPEIPKIDFLKRKELFEKEQEQKNETDSRRQSTDFVSTLSIKERLSVLQLNQTQESTESEKQQRTIPDVSFTDLKNRLEIFEREIRTLAHDKEDPSPPFPAMSHESSVEPLVSAVKDELKQEDELLEKSHYYPNSYSEMLTQKQNLTLDENENIDTDREDSGIHTTDVSCSVSQADEQTEDGEHLPHDESNVKPIHTVSKEQPSTTPEDTIQMEFDETNDISAYNTNGSVIFGLKSKSTTSELHNKRSSFLGIETDYVDEDGFMKFSIATPPRAAASILQEEKRLEKQYLLQTGLYDHSDAAESRDSGMSENHSRQSSDIFTTSSDDPEELIKPKIGDLNLLKYRDYGENSSQNTFFSQAEDEYGYQTRDSQLLQLEDLRSPIPQPIPPAKPLRSPQYLHKQYNSYNEHSKSLSNVSNIDYSDMISSTVSSSETQIAFHSACNNIDSIMSNENCDQNRLYNNLHVTERGLDLTNCLPKSKSPDNWDQYGLSRETNETSMDAYPLHDSLLRQRSYTECSPQWNVKASRHANRKSDSYTRHWFVQEAEQRRIEQQQQQVRGNLVSGYSQNKNANRKSLPESVIQTITQRVQNLGIGSERRWHPEGHCQARKTNNDNGLKSEKLNIQSHQRPSDHDEKVLSVSGKKKCSHCNNELVCDASGRYSGQSFFGNDFWLGSKSFCEEINRLYKSDNQTSFVEMAFFVTTIKVKLADFVPDVKPMQLGQCLPKSCSIRDVYHILKEDPISKKMLDSNTCQTGNTTQHNTLSCNLLDVTNLRLVPGSYTLLNDNRFYFLSLTLIVLITTVIFATYYENFVGATMSDSKNTKGSINASEVEIEKLSGMEQLVEPDVKPLELSSFNRNNNNGHEGSFVKSDVQNSKVGKHLGIISEILLCFAAGSNSTTILSVAKANKDSLTCIHGLRLYSLLWTIMVHTYLQLFAVGENRVARKITERSFSYQVVGNATFSVDTFFFISGLLIVVLYFRSSKNEPSNEKQNNNVFNSAACSNIVYSIVYRFIRLTPTYLFVIIFNELALKWTYGRSVFTPGIIDHITCNKYWWRNILYINNWYSFSEMCMIWSWYLANDMQFYVIAIIILTISSRYMKTSAFLLVLLMVCSWATSIFLSIHFNYTYKVAEPFESFDVLYDKPWQRITPYIIGMLTGYILHFKKTPPKVPVAINLILWAFSLLILFGLVFGVWDGTLSVPMTALYVSLGHTAWGVALIWITLSCCWGYAKPINDILSYQAFFPLSRLSYCAYLLHPVVMMATSFQMEAPMHLQHVIVITMFFGNAVLSFILAYFVSLIFEAPVVKLLKLAFRR
ncbi:uncharacterized protein LOC134224821 isoform X2 [Armigeres subalbatus]|uniref:uncharacterized protein LOC134224821 isoform X2 n=1 Tax=Armigeres subalbatus TaxID=124917 RepID=UPI002ED32BDD